MLGSGSGLTKRDLDLSLQLNQTAKRAVRASGDDRVGDQPSIEVE
jgi:hypothetical protein